MMREFLRVLGWRRRGTLALLATAAFALGWGGLVIWVALEGLKHVHFLDGLFVAVHEHPWAFVIGPLTGIVLSRIWITGSRLQKAIDNVDRARNTHGSTLQQQITSLRTDIIALQRHTGVFSETTLGGQDFPPGLVAHLRIRGASPAPVDTQAKLDEAKAALEAAQKQYDEAKAGVVEPRTAFDRIMEDDE